VFNSFGNHAQSQNLNFFNRVVARFAVNKNAVQRINFGNPAPVGFLFEFDC
jgi:hypothetical protein